MNWMMHSDLKGKHAILSASKYHWVHYDEDKLINWYKLSLARTRGEILHDFASQCIKLRQHLPKRKKTLNMFVNDSIDFRMRSEQVLRYSNNCFGTSDAISFSDSILRISDLKTGSAPAHVEQLEIYAALFCLEYNVDPKAIDIELRIYQSDEISLYTEENEIVVDVMNKIIDFDAMIENVRKEGIFDDI